MMHPQRELCRIYDFLGVDSSPEMVDKILNTPSRGIRQNYKGIQKKTINGWQMNLTEQQVVWLEKLYNNKRYLLNKVIDIE
jgi:hypothetical protein